MKNAICQFHKSFWGEPSGLSTAKAVPYVNFTNVNALLKNAILIASVILLLSAPSHANLLNAISDTNITGLTAWRAGGCFSNGEKFVFAHGIDTSVFIFNNVPTSGVPVNYALANVRMSGFSNINQGNMPNMCIIGNKLIIGDSDPTLGYCIKIWNTIPTSDTNSSSYDCKITGFTASIIHMMTDGTRLSVASGGHYIWNTVPVSDTLAYYSRNSYLTAGYAMGGGWFGANGRYYATHTLTADSVYYVSIFDSIPADTFSLISNKARIKLFSRWAAPHAAIEMRGRLYVFARDNDGVNSSIYIWKEIPDTVTADTSGISAKVAITSYYYYQRISADSVCFYRWNGSTATGYNIITNAYDVNVTGTDNAPSAIYRNQKNALFEIINIGTYPGEPSLTEMKFTYSGTCASADIPALKIYEDVNGDSSYTAGTDVLVCSGTFSGTSVVFTNLNYKISSGNKALLVCVDISETANINGTLSIGAEYFKFENNYTEYTRTLNSSTATLSDYTAISWNNELRLVSTKRQPDNDDSYSVILDWDDASNGMSPLSYQIYQVVDDSVLREISSEVSSATVSDNDASKKNKFKVRAVDYYGNMSQESNLAYDEVAPEWNKTFKVEDSSRINANGQWEYRVKVLWDTGTDNTTNDILYEVWTKETGKDWKLKTKSWDNSVEIAGLSGVYYVKLRARDCAGNYTGFSEEKKIKMNPYLAFMEEKEIDEAGGQIVITDMDGEGLDVNIPANAFTKRYSVNVEKLYESEYTYRLRLYGSDGIERKAVFKKPVTLKFRYKEDKIVRLGYSEDELRVDYNDGIKWINIGGKTDKTENTVSVEVFHFSEYRMSSGKSMSKIIVAVPETITPNDDGINDVLLLSPSWNFYGDISMMIFDMSGKKIWEYSGNNRTVVWDCRTDNGVPVESGAYVYSIRLEGKNYGGSFTVAK